VVFLGTADLKGEGCVLPGGFQSRFARMMVEEITVRMKHGKSEGSIACIRTTLEDTPDTFQTIWPSFNLSMLSQYILPDLKF